MMAYIRELYNRPNRPETLEVKPEEEVDADEKGPYIFQSEVEKAINELGMRRLQDMMMYLEMCSNYWEKVF
jgi:hypothetical protein